MTIGKCSNYRIKLMMILLVGEAFIFLMGIMNMILMTRNKEDMISLPSSVLLLKLLGGFVHNYNTIQRLMVLRMCIIL